jgi:hypothetical protein
MKTQFNNSLHVIIGAFLGWLLFQTFNGVPIAIQYFLTIFVVGVLSIFWEWFWKIKNNAVIDYWDVVRGVAGGVLMLTILNLWS